MPSSRPASWQVIAAFAAIYLIWGSTYLAIRLAIETIPPLLMAGTRFVVAGLALYALARARGIPGVPLASWGPALVAGGFLLLGGNGGVTWAEQTVPSGITAVLVATVPLWVVVLDWLRPGGTRPATRILAGVALGLVGIVVLIGPANIFRGELESLIGPLIVVIAALSWAAGTLYTRSGRLPSSPFMATAMEMICGGALLLAAGTVAGEWATYDPAAWSLRSLLALLYLIAFGSLIAFTAYIWLLHVTSPERAATYAYVNPVVAVLLGWALADEPLTLQTLAAAAIIIAAVAMITTFRAAPQPRPAMAEVSVES